MRLDRRVALGAILVAGAALRLYRIGDVPFGFHPDEAHNALDALAIRDGWRPVFLPGNNGREPLFMYGMAVLQAVLGPSIATARLTAALAGWLMIPAQYVFCRVLPLPRPRATALVAAAIAATTFWPVAQSRYAIEAVLLPPLVALALAAWWRAVGAVGGDGGVVASSEHGTAGRDAGEPPPAGRGTAGHAGPNGTDRVAVDHQAGAPRPARAAYAAAALAGAVIAAAMYSHLVGRLLVVVVAGSAVWLAWRRRDRRPLALAAVCLVTAAVLALPQAAYFARHVDDLTHRSAIVSIFNPAVEDDPPATALATNAWRLLGMALWEGDRSWSHNRRGRPVFDPLVGAFCLLGAALLARDLAGRRGPTAQSAAVLLALALGVTLAPSLLSIGAPNYTRLVGTWPVLFLLPAWGLERAAAHPGVRGRGWRPWLVAGVLGASAAWTAADYFGRYARDPRVPAAFNAAAVVRGRAAAAIAGAGPAYAMPALWAQSVIRYLNVGSGLRPFDPASGLVLPPAGTDARGTAYLFDPAEADRAADVARRWPEMAREDVRDLPITGAAMIAGTAPPAGRLDLVVLRLPAGWQPPGVRPAHPAVSFGDRIVLAGVGLAPPVVAAGATLTVTLLWEARAPTGVDHNLFLRLEQPDGRAVGQFDGPPLDNSYPTDRWRPGERIVQIVALPVAADAAAGMAVLRAGWYDWRSLQRLPVAGDDDAAADVAAVEIAPHARP